MADFLTPPANATIAPTGPVWLSEDGIIITINTVKTHTQEQAVENMVLTKQVGAGTPRPLLVDVTHVQSMSKEAREEYVKSESLEIVTAVALITKSGIGRMVGNLFIGLNKHVVPVKLFNDAHKAKEWLMQYKVK